MPLPLLCISPSNTKPWVFWQLASHHEHSLNSWITLVKHSTIPLSPLRNAIKPSVKDRWVIIGSLYLWCNFKSQLLPSSTSQENNSMTNTNKYEDIGYPYLILLLPSKYPYGVPFTMIEYLAIWMHSWTQFLKFFGTPILFKVNSTTSHLTVSYAFLSSTYVAYHFLPPLLWYP